MKAMLGRSAFLAVFAMATPALAAPVQSDGVDGSRSAFAAAVSAHAGKAITIANQIRQREGLTEVEYVNLGQALLGAAPQELDAAASATSYKGAMSALKAAKASRAKALGDNTREFVFYPFPPCRLLDTRANGIRLTPMTPYGVDFDGGNPGNAAGCTFAGQVAAFGGTTAGFSNTALMINLTVTGSLAGGFIQARPVGTTAITSNQNYLAGQDLANMVVVQDAGTAAEFELFASSATHAVVDVMGLFAAPLSTPLECTTVVASNATVANGSSFSITASCPAGYGYSGAGSNFTSGQSPFTWWQVSPNVPTTGGVPTGTTCRGINETGFTSPVHCYANCCRVPGR